MLSVRGVLDSSANFLPPRTCGLSAHTFGQSFGLGRRPLCSSRPSLLPRDLSDLTCAPQSHSPHLSVHDPEHPTTHERTCCCND